MEAHQAYGGTVTEQDSTVTVQDRLTVSEGQTWQEVKEAAGKTEKKRQER